jgi:DNA polymerase III subunit alpha
MKQSWNADKYEFKPTYICLLETAKSFLTKSLDITLHPKIINEQFIKFISKNIKTNPGDAMLKINCIDPIQQLKVSLYNNSVGFKMNDELADFLLKQEDIEIGVGL